MWKWTKRIFKILFLLVLLPFLLLAIPFRLWKPKGKNGKVSRREKRDWVDEFIMYDALFFD